MPREPTSPTTIGKNVRLFRIARGMSQPQLGEASGINGSLVSMIETGARPNPTIDTLEALAVALGVTVPILLREAVERDDPGLPPSLREFLATSAGQTVTKAELQLLRDASGPFAHAITIGDWALLLGMVRRVELLSTSDT